MPTVTRFHDRASVFTDVLAAAHTRWDAPTPCAGWTVRDVVAHVIDTQRDFLARHDLAAPDTPDLSDPAAAWRTHAGSVASALDADGVADRAYDGYFGPTTLGATMADFYGWDLMVHAWDVAAATGRAHEISDAQAAEMSATADGWGDALYGDGICGPPVPVPDDAPAADRLLGRLGRDPGWRPAFPA